MADDHLQKAGTSDNTAKVSTGDSIVADEINPSCREEAKKLEFSDDEETLIIRMHSLLGDRWPLIAGRIPGRSAEEIEKYWNSRHSTNQSSSKNLKRGNKEVSRRIWSPEEEKVLLVSLKSLVAQGYKSDNGFRIGYLKKLEEAMKMEFPFSNIKAEPHIRSKLTAWKKTYGAIMSILSRSGVGFNVHGDEKIDADPEAWEEIIRTDSSAGNFRDKPLPMLAGWKAVFGKDRATGEGAKDVMESVNELVAEHQKFEGPTRNTKHENFVDLEEDDQPQPQTQPQTESVCQSSMGDSKPTSSSKKRKEKDRIDNLSELLNTIHKDTNTRLQELTNVLGYHADLGKLRKEVWPLLDNMDEFTIDEKLCSCEKLVLSTEKLQMFMSLPEIARAAYVRRLL